MNGISSVLSPIRGSDLVWTTAFRGAPSSPTAATRTRLTSASPSERRYRRPAIGSSGWGIRRASGTLRVAQILYIVSILVRRPPQSTIVLKTKKLLI